MDTAERVKKVFDSMGPSRKEVASLISDVIRAVKEAQKALRSEMASNSKECKDMCDESCAKLETAVYDLKSFIKESLSKSEKETQDKAYKQLNAAVYNLEQQIKNIEVYDDSLLETKWATVVEDLRQRIENVKPYIMSATEVRDSLESLREDDRLDISAVKGFDKLIADLKGSGKNVRLVGGTNGIMVYNGTTKLGIVKYVNFSTGFTASLVNGMLTLTTSGGGGSSGFQQPTSGIVDGVNATFTWATAPNAIVVDGGRSIQKVSADGTVNWTGTTTTVLSIAPNFDVYATA